MPVRRPVASLTKWPLRGSGVVSVSPAMADGGGVDAGVVEGRIPEDAGRSGTARSSRSRVRLWSPKKAGSHRTPMTSAPVTVAAWARVRVRMSSGVRASPSWAERTRSVPPSIRWTWASRKPGRTRRPPASIRCAWGRRARMSASDPSARMRPSRNAIACAAGRAGSIVRMRALRRTVSVMTRSCPSRRRG